LLIAAALLVSLCTSCAVRPPLGVEAEKEPCPQRIIDLIRTKTPDIRSIKGTADVDVSGDEPGMNQHLQIGLAAERPDKIRFNVYAGFSTVMSIAVNGDSLWVFLPSSSLLMAGSIDEAEGLGILPAAANVLLDALREVLFPEPICGDGCKSERIANGRCRFEEDSEDGKRISIFETGKGRLLSTDFVDKDGEERARVSYRDYRTSSGLYFPREITLSFKSEDVRAKLTFHRVELNREIDANIFRFKDVTGVTQRGLERSLESE